MTGLNQPRIERDRLRELIYENTGRTIDEDEDKPTTFVYHEWPDDIEARTLPKVKTVNEHGKERMPMESGVCRHCASDMTASDGRVIVCTTCGAFHPIP